MYRLLLPQTVGAWEGAGSAQGLNIPHCARQDLSLLRPSR